MDLISVRLSVSDMFEAVASVFPEELSALIKKETFIAGGVFKSLVLDETPNDWDFWFRNKEASEKFKELLDKTERTKSSYLTNHDNLKINKLLIKTDNAYTIKFPKAVVQFVFTEIGSPVDVVKNFDFKHAQCYYDPMSGTMSCPTQHIIGKKLIFTGAAKTPLNAMKRALKFVSQGWTIEDAEVDKIAKAITGINWSDPVVVKKQTKPYYAQPQTAQDVNPDIGRQRVYVRQEQAVPEEQPRMSVPQGYGTTMAIDPQAYAQWQGYAASQQANSQAGGLQTSEDNWIYTLTNR